MNRYIVNYSPFDIGIRVANYSFVCILIVISKEVLRIRRLNAAIDRRFKFMPGNLIGLTLYSHVYACGSIYMRYLIRVCNGQAKNCESFLTRGNALFKVSMLFTLALVAQRNDFFGHYFTNENICIFTFLSMLNCTFAVSMNVSRNFSGPETFFCHLVFAKWSEFMKFVMSL